MNAEAARSSGGGRARPRPREARNVFEPRPDGLAAAIGRRFGSRRPAAAAVVVWALAFLLLGALMIGVGLLLKEALLPAGLGGVESGWSRWFVSERTPTLNTVSHYGSGMGSTMVVVGIAVATALVLAVGKYWRQIVFLVCALTLEVGLFLLTGLLIARHRPGVPQLDAAPPTSSYPSGHMASAMTLYVGLAIVALSVVREPVLRTTVWVVAVTLPLLVGSARLYRGMHYPTDVAASVLLAAGALGSAVLAVRSMGAASTERERRGAATASIPADRADRTPAHPAPPEDPHESAERLPEVTP